MKSSTSARKKSLKSDLNRFALVALFTGAAMWLFLIYGLDLVLPPGLSRLEMLLVLVALGIPAAAFQLDPKDLAARRVALRFGFAGLAFMGVVSLLSQMPLALVAEVTAGLLCLAISIAYKLTGSFSAHANRR